MRILHRAHSYAQFVVTGFPPRGTTAPEEASPRYLFILGLFVPSSSTMSPWGAGEVLPRVAQPDRGKTEDSESIWAHVHRLYGLHRTTQGGRDLPMMLCILSQRLFLCLHT